MLRSRCRQHLLIKKKFDCDKLSTEPKPGCVLVYRYTKERNINELRHNSMYGYENNRNSPVYRYTRTAPKTSSQVDLR